MFNALSNLSDGLLDECAESRSEKAGALSAKRFAFGYSAAAALFAICVLAAVVTAVRFQGKDPGVFTTENGNTATRTNETQRGFSVIDVSDGSSPLGAFRGDMTSNIFTSSAGAYMQYGFVMTFKAVEMLPDEYALYGDWNKNKYRFVLMRTENVILGDDVPEYFYFLLPEKYVIDLTAYDKLLAVGIVQLYHENQLVYNETQARPERLEHVVICSATHWNTLAALDVENLTAFTDDGAYDDGIWNASESWKKFAARAEQMRGWYEADGINTLSEYEEYLTDYLMQYQDRGMPCRFLSDYKNEEDKKIISYVTSSENGLFVKNGHAELLNGELYSNVSSFTRYIGGYPTNEIYHIYADGAYVNGSSLDREPQFKFSKEDLEDLPDLPGAVNAIEKALEEKEVYPPHFADWEKYPIDFNDIAHSYSYGVFGFYSKTPDGVLGVVRVTWKYDNIRSGLGRTVDVTDDAYFIIEPGSDTVTPIDRDGLLSRLGSTSKPVPYVYTGEYYEYGRTWNPKILI